MHDPQTSIPKVMIVTTMPSTVDVFLTEQIEAMQAAGFGVTVVTSPDERLGQLRNDSFAVRPLTIPRQIRPVKLAMALVGLYRLFWRCRPDLVHTHTPIAAFLGQIAAWLARVPSRITTVHGLYFVGESRRIPRFIYRVLEITACKLATKVICVSAEDARYLIEKQGFAAAKVAVMHVGVNLQTYSPEAVGSEARRVVRKELGIPDNAFVFGTVARLVREKGMGELFQAFGQLAKRHPNIYLLHVGPEDRTRRDAISPAEAEQYGAAERCRFAGHQYDVARYLSAMDIFCLPTYREGYPVSVMEASAMGLPCVVTDIRGCREAVVDGETGLIVPPRDAVALEKAMERLLGSSALRQSMAFTARNRAGKCFDRKEVAKEIVSLYRKEIEH